MEGSSSRTRHYLWVYALPTNKKAWRSSVKVGYLRRLCIFMAHKRTHRSAH